MTAVNQVGNPLTGSTGTGAFVGAQSPTIVTPVIAQINDVNGNAELAFSATASSVNYLQINNNSIGLYPDIAAIGSDTDIGINFTAKGAAPLGLQSARTTNQVIFNTGTALVHTTNFNFPVTAASRTVTWPDADGTVAFTSGASGIINSGTANQLAYYASAGTTLSGVGPGSTGQIFQSNGAGSSPAYTTTTYPSTNAINTIMYASSADTLGVITPVNSAALVSNGSGVPSWAAMSAGKVLVGTTAGAPAAATISSGTGITVTSGSGSISIAAIGGGLAWNTIAGTTQNAVVNSGYVPLNSSVTSVKLPSTAAVGSIVSVAGFGTGGWHLVANLTQTIKYIGSTTTTAGSLNSAEQFDAITVVCVEANTTWVVQYASTTGLTIV